MSDHTKGPWLVLDRILAPGKIDLIPVGKADYTVATVHCYGENADSNARLIAEAPSLLDRKSTRLNSSHRL